MSITSDIRGYADSAVNQGKQALDQSLASAQAQLNDLAGTATDLAGSANEAVNDLRASAEKAINLDAIKTAVEPYLAQAREYSAVVTDRAEELLAGFKDDPRFSTVIDTATTVSGAVIEQVNEYVVKPVQSFTGIGARPASTARPRKAPRVAVTKPANKPSTRRPAAKRTASKSTASKSTASKSTAPKPTARKASASKSTAPKPTARKAPAKRTAQA